MQRACDMLLSPTAEALDQCSLLLDATARDLAGCRPEPGDKGCALQEARLLHSAVRRARILLDCAFSFRQAWSRRLGAITAGYTVRGELAAHAGSGVRLAVRG
jgi:hypothetical protein